MVTAQAEGADIRKIAFTAAFNDGDDVVCIPETFSGHAGEAPVVESLSATIATGAFELQPGFYGVDAAQGADAFVAGENAVAKVAGVGAQFPLMDAPFRAEGAAGRTNFESAPAAKGASGGPFGEFSSFGKAAGHGAVGAHLRVRVKWCSRG